MNESVISCEAIGKRYRVYDNPRDRLIETLSHLAGQWLPAPSSGQDFWALRNVSFSVNRGETVAVIGRNGSGKSTLLQIIAGTLAATEGRVLVDGRVAALLELGSGFNPEFTGVENVRMNAAVLGLDSKTIDQRLDAILAFADIGEHHVHQPVRTYSSGMYVRLAFAVAIHVDPDVLIVDEALSVGDIAFQAKCMARIRRLQQEGRTLLFVSHDVGAVRALCDRCIYLDQGTVRDMGLTPPVVDHFIRDVHAELAEAARERGAAPGATPAEPASAFVAADLSERCAAFDAARNGERYGTGEARVRLVEMLDTNDRPVAVAEFDAPVRIRIWVECAQPCTVSVNYKIRDRYLVPVAGADFLIASTELVQMKPGGCYVIEYGTRLPLMAGDYSLRISVTVPIARHDEAVFVDVVEVTNSFRILPAVRGRIYTQVYLPNSVSVESYRQGESR